MPLPGTYGIMMARPGDVLVNLSYLVAARDFNFLTAWPGDVLVTSLTWPLLDIDDFRLIRYYFIL